MAIGNRNRSICYMVSKLMNPVLSQLESRHILRPRQFETWGLYYKLFTAAIYGLIS
jgi:hypothetical protein